MRRSIVWAIGLVFVLAAVGASAARGADSPDLQTVGIDAFPLAGQNQPSPIGGFNGTVGIAFFSVGEPGTGGHFEADMRPLLGSARNPLTGASRAGQWGLT